MKHIMDAIDKLSKTHPEHISQYGTGAPFRATLRHYMSPLAEGDCMQ